MNLERKRERERGFILVILSVMKGKIFLLPEIQLPKGHHHDAIFDT
jgi:hypothetical protein